ncbi:hypothetical protein [Nereida sp. MMG025]|uniref:hypothetical protein n=1 Tax=Nereida sp. MMG025 TaxID=2909981 RepID=UPI001F394E7E|nr:hypothetical protein [Nereida sp. MMG025]MCF6445200.1 hypothetical protein [Nereida sp. MMG025]
MPAQKIATCCYCGTRAALVLKGQDRHELSCSNCGAPLHDLKMLPKADLGQKRELIRPNPVRTDPDRYVKKPKAKKGKRRKSTFKRFLSKAWDRIEDAVEDVVDEIFD